MHNNNLVYNLFILFLFFLVGRGFGEATVGVVDKQYGHDASEATK